MAKTKKASPAKKTTGVNKAKPGLMGKGGGKGGAMMKKKPVPAKKATAVKKNKPGPMGKGGGKGG